MYKSSIQLFSFSLVLLYFLTSCSPKTFIFTNEVDNSVIDYSNIDHWASHPAKTDPADQIPAPLSQIDQATLDVDVFFIHPTTYTGKVVRGLWNAPINDKQINGGTDQSTIKLQGSIFNAAGRMYAPRYRQAHIQAFYTLEKAKGQKALDIAYRDVKNAFEYYLENENQDRPFIIASHSQGTVHAVRLIQEFIDGQALQQKLVAAYLIGMPVRNNVFKSLAPCQTADDISCFVSWRTLRKNYLPEAFPTGPEIIVHNPLNWKMDDTFIPKDQSKGMVLRNFDKVLSHRVDAQVHDGVLWVNKPKFPWSFLFTRKNYHIVDLNFFYVDVRENAVHRVHQYTDKKNLGSLK
jgi:hypothetical protein